MYNLDMINQETKKPYTNKTAQEDTMANNSNRPIPTKFSDFVVKDMESKECTEEMLLRDLNNNFLETRKELIAELERAQREIEGALKGVKLFCSLNRHGILQGTGTNIDKLAAQYMHAAEVEKVVAHSLGFAKPSTDTCWK